MIRLPISLLFLLYCSHPLFSQQSYLKGYVVLTTGDTLHGEVKDRDINIGRLLSRIRFKQNGKKLKKYSAYDVSSYSIDNVVFASKWYEEQAEFFNSRYLNQYGRGEKVFLRVNSKGRLSCYTKEFVDQDDVAINGFELFIKEGDDYFERANQGLFGLKKKKLTKYFSDCPALVENINNGDIRTALEVAVFYNSECDK